MVDPMHQQILNFVSNPRYALRCNGVVSEPRKGEPATIPAQYRDWLRSGIRVLAAIGELSRSGPKRMFTNVPETDHASPIEIAII
jgi:hypothetical protein